MTKYEEFVKYYYKHGKCINDISKRKKPLTEKQLKSRYEKYIKSEIKKSKKDNIDLKWEELRLQVVERDKECRLLPIITFDEYMCLKKKAGKFLEILEVAHVFSRGAFPELKYEINNLVLLNKYSHQMLDNYKHPITGKPISKQEHNIWWRRILGEEQFNLLMRALERKLK